MMISVTICEMVAVVHRRQCLHHLVCCSVNSRQAQNRDFCLPHLHSTPPLGGFPSEYRHPVWYGKTRMAWLPDVEKIPKISLFVLTQLTNVTDTQTDTQTDTAWRHRPRLCIASRGKKRTGDTVCRLKLYLAPRLYFHVETMALFFFSWYAKGTFLNNSKFNVWLFRWRIQKFC